MESTTDDNCVRTAASDARAQKGHGYEPPRHGFKTLEEEKVELLIRFQIEEERARLEATDNQLNWKKEIRNRLRKGEMHRHYKVCATCITAILDLDWDRLCELGRLHPMFSMGGSWSDVDKLK